MRNIHAVTAPVRHVIKQTDPRATPGEWKTNKSRSKYYYPVTCYNITVLFYECLVQRQ